MANALNDALAGAVAAGASGADRIAILSDIGGGGTVTDVTATAPLTSTGGATPDIGIDLGAGGSLATVANKLTRAALTGDVTASSDSNATTVAKINGNPLGSTTPTAGNFLAANGTNWAGTTTHTSTVTFNTGQVLVDEALPAAPASGRILNFSFNQQGFSVQHVTDSTGADLEPCRDNLTIVRNTSGASIAKGSAVYITGGVGSNPSVAKARANSSSTMPCLGLMFETTANNAWGRVMVLGNLESFDTSAWVEGTRLYVSTATAGLLTSTRPAPTNYIQCVGTVLSSGVGNGVIGIQPAGYEGLLTGDPAGGDLTGTYPNPTLAAVGTSGTKGTAAKVPVFVTDTKGRVTSNTDTDIAIAASQVTSGTLATARGGTNADSSASTGYPYVTAGAWAFGAGFTRQAVSSASPPTVTGADNKYLDITTLGANFTSTLPAATSGQLIVFADGLGTAASGAFIAKLAANGSETFLVPGINGSGGATALYLAEDYGSIVLLGLAGTGWRVVGGNGWGVDPRTISGLELWCDARRGLTYASSTSRLISQWNDYSGNGRDTVQATASRQPVPARVGGLAVVGFDGAGGGQFMESSAFTISTGTGSFVSLCALHTPTGAAVAQGLFGIDQGATTGWACWLQRITGADWIDYDLANVWAGSNSGLAPRTVGYVGTASGTNPITMGYGDLHVVSGVGSATASATNLWFDGRVVTQRVRSDGTVQTQTSKKVVLGSANNAPGAPMNGSIQSFMLFSTALSTANRQLLEGDLMRQAR